MAPLLEAMMLDTSKLLCEGMDAALDDQPIEACPYADWSREHALWIEGWAIATEHEAGHIPRPGRTLRAAPDLEQRQVM